MNLVEKIDNIIEEKKAFPFEKHVKIFKNVLSNMDNFDEQKNL